MRKDLLLLLQIAVHYRRGSAPGQNPQESSEEIHTSRHEPRSSLFSRAETGTSSAHVPTRLSYENLSFCPSKRRRLVSLLDVGLRTRDESLADNSCSPHTVQAWRNSSRPSASSSFTSSSGSSVPGGSSQTGSPQRHLVPGSSSVLLLRDDLAGLVLHTQLFCGSSG